jgi:HEAT repeat protein
MRRLQSLLSIRPGEGRLAFRLLALMLIGMAGAMIGANGVESLFFTRFGPEFLPYLYLILGPLTFGVMVAMGPLVSGEAVRFLVRLPLLQAGLLVLARASLWLGASWLYPVLWLVMMILWTSQVMASWALAGAVSDTRQAKRLFPLYGAGLIAGGAVGGLATGPLAGVVHAENLLWAWAAALIGVHLLARSLPGADIPRRRRTARPNILRQMAGGFRDVWEWPLLRWMSVSLMLFALLYFTLALLFAEAATARFPRADDLAGFLGVFQGAVSGAALLVSLLLANRLFARFGLPTAVLALTVIYTIGFGLIAVWPGFAALLVFRFVQMVWVNGVWATGWQALFNVVPAERRARTRTFMDGGPLQAGIVLAGALLLLADRVLAPEQLAVVGAIGGVLAMGAMWRARRTYGGALVEALRTGNPDVFRAEEEPFGGFRTDAEAHAALVSGTGNQDPAVRRISTEILADAATPESAESLAAVLDDADPEVRAAAARGLARAGSPAQRDRLAGLLGDPQPAVRAEAAGALLRHSDRRAEETLRRMAMDPRPAWRAAAASALGRAGDREALAGLRDPDPSVRRAAAEALGAAETDAAEAALAGALEDDDPGVRAAAARALVSLGRSGEETLVRALDRPNAEPHALLALMHASGPPPPGLQRYARSQAEAARRYHRLWAAVAGPDDERGQLLAHALRHRALTHGLNTLRAAARLDDTGAMAVALENLASPEPEQRANALETLESVGDPEIVRPVLPLWDPSPDRTADRTAARAELLDDPDPWLRACAAVAIDGTTATARLHELAEGDPDPLVRQAVSLALGGDGVKTLSTVPLLERVVFLRKVPMFADLSPADLKHIAEVASEHAYPDGEVVAEQGERGDEMHIVVAGEIRVMVGGDGRPGREVARRTAGEYVGEMAILDAAPRMASLVAAGSVRTLSLDRRAFERILRERPDVSLGVMRVLSDRLRDAHAGDLS